MARRTRRSFAFGTEHLSLYQLTIEPATPFATLYKTGRCQISRRGFRGGTFRDDAGNDGGAGVPAYEISNHARPGAEARHNLLYWRYGAYAGVGPGAHGRLDLNGTRFATMCERLPERWRENVAREGHGITEMTAIGDDDAAREHLLMNLRLSEGIDLADYRARWGRAPSAERIAALAADGFVACDRERLCATARGRLVLNRRDQRTCLTRIRWIWNVMGAGLTTVKPPGSTARYGQTAFRRSRRGGNGICR